MLNDKLTASVCLTGSMQTGHVVSPDWSKSVMDWLGSGTSWSPSKQNFSTQLTDTWDIYLYHCYS